LKLLDVPNIPTAIILLAVLVGGPLLWMSIRRRHGFPALARVEARQRAARSIHSEDSEPSPTADPDHDAARSS